MSLRDTVREIKVKNPLCSKRLVVENLSEVLGLLEDDFKDLAKERIESLIEDIDLTNKLDAGQL